MISTVDAFNLDPARIRFYEQSWNGRVLTYGYCYFNSTGMFDPFILGRLNEAQRKCLCFSDEGKALVKRHDAVVEYIAHNGRDATSVLALLVPKEALTDTSRIEAPS